ncbi:hypothetical protein B0T22DRAFT_507798 [Podospora appendiculata]|uniref:Uncharacterized protein n=1 Tax=Podospora appendiculata TaxID=314037 RepID=A0AAE1CI35_9PEZI|nr:hypothetical protein B0T22DRAFT_507798 [Podospora appendiculata]
MCVYRLPLRDPCAFIRHQRTWHPRCSSSQKDETAQHQPESVQQSSHTHTNTPTMLLPLIVVSVLANTAVLAAPSYAAPNAHSLQAKPQPGTMAQKLARLARRWDVYEAYGRYWAYWNPPQRDEQPIPTPLPSIQAPLISTTFLSLTGTGLATAPAPAPTSASAWTSVLTVTLWPNTTFTPFNAAPTSTETVLVTLLPDRPQTLTLTPPFIVVTVSEEAAPAVETTVTATAPIIATPIAAPPAPEGQTVTLLETNTLTGASGTGLQTLTSLVVVPVSTPASAPTAPPVEVVTVYSGTTTVTVHDLVTID